MRFLHTADWHMGKTLYRRSRAEDELAMMDEIAEIARDQRPDVILHAGDVFDSYRPSADAMTRAVNGLLALSKIAPVIAVRGNHDSPQLISLLDRLAAVRGHNAQLRLVSGFGSVTMPSRDGTERARVACVPFVHANDAIAVHDGGFSSSEGEWHSAYTSKVGQVLDDASRWFAKNVGRGDTNILLVHLMVNGARISGSEKALHVGESYAVRQDSMGSRAAYVALGHVHMPQDVGSGLPPARYSGSPLQLDFGEAGESKSVTIVDTQRGGSPEYIPLTRARRLRRVETGLGELEDAARRIVAEGDGGSILRFTVRTPTPTPDLADRVTALLPQASVLRVTEDCAATKLRSAGDTRRDGRGDGTGVQAPEEPSLKELFRTYLAETGTPGAEANRVARGFDVLLAREEAREMGGDARPATDGENESRAGAEVEA